MVKILVNQRQQDGFVHVLLFVIIFLLIAGMSVFAYTYVKNQNKEKLAKEQATQAANAEIAKLKAEASVPDGWSKIKLDDGTELYLPDGWTKYNAIGEQYSYNKPPDSTDLQIYSKTPPKIHISLAGSNYCQLDSGQWVNYSNSSGTYKPDTSANAKSFCQKINPLDVLGADGFEYEIHDINTSKYYVVVKVGSSHYVFSDSKTYNNYGEEAIQALVSEGQNQLKDLVRIFVESNG